MDITKCKGEDKEIICPYREKCYRFTAQADEFWQAFFVGIPLKDGKCDHYWGANAESIWNQLNDILNGEGA